jgi:hypothetical protein
MVFGWIKKSFSSLFKSKRRRKTVKRKRSKKRSLRRKTSRKTVHKIRRTRSRVRKTAVKRKKPVPHRPVRTQRIQTIERRPEFRAPQPAAGRFYPRKAYFPSLNNTPPERQMRAVALVSSPSAVKIGTLSHYFSKILVGVLTVENLLKEGDSIEILRKGTRVGKEVVRSMQINRIPIAEAKKGEEIGLKLKTAAQVGDEVYKI